MFTAVAGGASTLQLRELGLLSDLHAAELGGGQDPVGLLSRDGEQLLAPALERIELPVEGGFPDDDVALAAPYLAVDVGDLLHGDLLRVSLEDVRELGGRTDQPQRVRAASRRTLSITAGSADTWSRYQPTWRWKTANASDTACGSSPAP